MKFCPICDNFLYIKLDDDQKLVHHCKNCNYSSVNQETGSVCIMDNNYIDDNTNYQQYINRFLKYDPSLPRVNNIICSNPQCSKAPEQENEIIFVKYDFNDMKYMYHCVYCNQFWKSKTKN
jgi:hypothetical protein